MAKIHLLLRSHRARWALVFLAAATLLSGCTRILGAPEPVTIRFAFRQNDRDYYQTLAEKFKQEYPYITVELLSRDRGLERLGPTEADVRVVEQEVSLLAMMDQGDILNLEPYIEQDQTFDIEDYYPGTLDLLTFDGKTWGVPAGMDFLVMYYNRDLFDRLAVPYPQAGWDWKDFLQAVQMLSDPEGGFAGYASNILPYDALMFIYQHGGKLFDNLQDPQRTTFTDPRTIEALEFYSELYKVYYMASTSEEMEQYGSDEHRLEYGIDNGRIGMWMDLYSQQGGTTSPVPWMFRWGMVTLPQDARMVTGGFCESYVISSRAYSPDAAWKWISFLSHQVPPRLLPARQSVLESPLYEAQVGRDVVDMARLSLENHMVISPSVYLTMMTQLDNFSQAVEKIINGTWTAQEAMEWAQSQSGQ